MTMYDPREHGALCDRCILADRRAGGPVPPEEHAGALCAIVGETPGDVEVSEGRPFVGPSGLELMRALEVAGIRRGQVHITNAGLCQPRGNRMDRLLAELKRENTRRQAEGNGRTLLSPLDACRPRLVRELQQFSRILTVGSSSTKAVLAGNPSILDVRGALLDGRREPIRADGTGGRIFKEPDGGWKTESDGWQPVKLLPTLHPAFVLHQRRWTKVFRADVARAIRWFRGRLAWKEPWIKYNPSVGELHDFLFDPRREALAFDVETDRLEPTEALVRCISFADVDGGMVIALRSCEEGRGGYYSPKVEREIRDVIARWLSDPARLKVGHNAGYYDRLVCRHEFGVDVAPLLDTILIHRVVESELPHNLGFVASLFDDVPAWKAARTATSATRDLDLWRYCLHGSTRVVLADGSTACLQRVVTRRQQVAVLSLGKDGRVEPRRVIGWHSNRVVQQQWIRVRVERGHGGGLLLTPEHRVYTARGEIEAAQLRPGDTLFVPERAPPGPYLPVAVQVVSAEPVDLPRWTGAQRWRSDTRYCLTVEGNHNFFTTCGLVSNCLIDSVETERIRTPLLAAAKARDQMRVLRVDHRIQSICADMHSTGMYVDQKRRAEWERKLTGELLRFSLQCKVLAGLGVEHNPGSVDQVRDLLFRRWKLPVQDETESGEPSTNDDSLRALLISSEVEQKQKDYILALRDYRKRSKQLGTYVAKLKPRDAVASIGFDEDESEEERSDRARRGKAKPGICHPDGRIRPDYNAHVATTGRLSSSNPDAQNFPDRLRDIITAAPGNVLVGADSDQIELRIAAARWGVERYLKAFREGRDPHAETALMCFQDLFRNCKGQPTPDKPKGSGEYKDMRGTAKNIQYLSQYGGGDEKCWMLMQGVEDEDGKLVYLKLTLPEVRLLRKRWLDSVPEFPRGWNREVEFWQRNGYLSEPVLGRRRDFLDGLGGGEDEMPFNELVNFPIQASAASLIHLATIKLVDNLPRKWGPGLITQTHDSLTLEVAEGYAEDAVALLRDCMNFDHTAFPGMPFTATPKVGHTWKEV